jgi:phenylalanyl-tRNA synthetase beta subunit
VPNYENHLGLVVVDRKAAEGAYAEAKRYLEVLLDDELKVKYELRPLQADKTPLKAPFEPKRTAEIWQGGKLIGAIGEFSVKTRKNFKLPEYVAGIELNISEF